MHSNSSASTPLNIHHNLVNQLSDANNTKLPEVTKKSTFILPPGGNHFKKSFCARFNKDKRDRLQEISQSREYSPHIV